MDLGAWLRSLGLERYEAAFRDNAIAADVLRELTDQDLEKIGVLLGDRRRLLRAIATLDETAATPTSPAPAPTTAKSTPATTAPSPVSAVVEVSGERPNVVTLRANQPELLKADAKERFTLEDAIRQATETTGKARTEAAAETRTRPPSATAASGPPHPDRAIRSERSAGGGLARCAPQRSSEAAERAVCGERTSCNEPSPRRCRRSARTQHRRHRGLPRRRARPPRSEVRARREYAEARNRSRAVGGFRGAMLEVWPTLTPNEKRELLGGFVERVVVRAARGERGLPLLKPTNQRQAVTAKARPARVHRTSEPRREGG